MATRAGLFTEVIEVLTLQESEGTFGDMRSEWVVEKNTRARVVYGTGKRANENDEIVNTYTPTFIVRHYHKLSEANNRIRYKGVVYRIVSLPPMDRESMDIVIVCDKVLE